jgi:thymidylate kinase
MKTLFVNIFGGPGTGKSTMASSIFSQLKREGVDAELISEYAKDLVWDRAQPILGDQIYVFGHQHHRCFRLNGQVEVAISDSPTIQGLAYKTPNLSETFDALVAEAYKMFNNLNIFLERKHEYNPNGRNQTEKEARDIDEVTMAILNKHDIAYHSLPAEDKSIEKIINIVYERLGKN